MDKYMKRSFTKLRTALAILIACCLTTDMYAQTAVAADSVATDTVAQLVSGVNTPSGCYLQPCWYSLCNRASHWWKPVSPAPRTPPTY